MSNSLVKSSFLQIIKGKKASLVYHSLFGYPQILNNDALSLLDVFSTKKEVSETELQNEFDDPLAQIELLKNCFFLVPSDFNEREFLKNVVLSKYAAMIDNGSLLEYLSLIVAEICNFKCAYCIADSMITISEREKSPNKLMSFEIAKLAVDTFMSILKSHGKKIAYVNFGGGEPLLNWKVVEKVLAYCIQQYGKQFQFEFTINSNISLLTFDIAKKFKTYGVKIATSLDGTKVANNAVRVTKSGKGTFQSILRAIDVLEKIDYTLGGFSTTITEQNFHLINEGLIDFAAQRGFNNLSVDLDVIHMLKIPVEKTAKKLLHIKRAAYKAGILVTGFWERAAENLNNSILDKFIAFCGGVSGRSMCVSPQGEIYICGYSVESIAHLTTGINGIITSPIYKRIITNRLAGETQRCRGCPLEGMCIGACHTYGRV